MILPISTTTDYLSVLLDTDNESEIISNFYDDNDNSEQISLIGEILAIEHSIYLLRRANQICGSHIDNIVSLRRKLITQYEKNHGDWLNDNENEMY